MWKHHSRETATMVMTARVEPLRQNLCRFEVYIVLTLYSFVYVFFLSRLLGFSMIFVLRAFALDLLLSALSFYTCRLSLHEGFPSLEIRNPDIRKTRTQNIMNTHLVGDPVLSRSRPRLFLVPRSRYAGRRSKSVAPPRARWSPSVPLESGDIASHGARRRPMVGHTIRRCQFGRVSERGCNIRRSKRPEAP